MPNSVSSVRGLGRTLCLDDPDDTPEQMMRRIDRDEVEAVCRHLVGTVGTVGTVDTAHLEPAGRR